MSWLDSSWDWFKTWARDMWPYVLLSLFVAFVVLSMWFGYHVYFGRLR